MRSTGSKSLHHHSRQSPGRTRGLGALAKQIVARFSSDRCTMMGASIAFYSAFSLAPTLVIVLAVAGWFFGRDAAQGRLFTQVKGILGADAASAIQAIVENAHFSGKGGFAALISIVLLAVGASATFSSLNTALDVVFHARSPKGIAGVALLLRARLVSLGLVMGLAFLLVVSLVLDAAIQTVGHAIFGSTALTVFAEVAQSLLGLLILTIGLGALIKWLPDVHVAIRPALIGGLVASVLFTLGRHLFGLYLAHAGTAGSFGAAGSLAVLMMWLYFCAAVFLLGAEVVAALSGVASYDDDESKMATAPPGLPAKK
ncbi:YihY/virulence factor BrkB family protein [Paraburkholderia sp. LEh10]|uniref:YihY/virulence factor BrkB family protein n=1 Tax=Paraburkholderia sp. LEh10 TaxID=2821353 RepID=UPI001AE24BFA|nr:YihY/virulence factor BrkB family protein [Paraburkholderia sp. LEh10]MBP0594080.1 YihY/virulence factor BrkB family protein [Paraburkholderia sp. LEh10]